MTTQAQKAADFRALHEGEPFVIPNPWDAGSAKVFEALGFKALATTSSGFAFTLGRLDGNVTLDEIVDHTRALDGRRACRSRSTSRTATDPIPRTPQRRSRARPRPGAVGGSIEDYDPGGELYGLDHAVERVAAAVEAARALSFPFTLTARAENHIRGNPDLDDTIARLQAYERAGADVLYAPGLRNGEEISAVCDAVSKPVNVLALAGLSMGEIVEAGGKRVSVGGGLAWVAIGRDGERRRADPRRRRLLGAGRAGQGQGLARRLMAALRRLPARGQPRRQAKDRQRRAALLLRGDRPGGRADVPDQRQRGVRRGRESQAKLSGASRGRSRGVRLRGRRLPAHRRRGARDRRPRALSRQVGGGLRRQAAGGDARREAVGGPASRCSRSPTDEDRLAFEGLELYWLPSGGMRDSGAQPEGRREARRAVDDAHQGDRRAAGGEVLRLDVRLVRTSVRRLVSVICRWAPCGHAVQTSPIAAADRRRGHPGVRGRGRPRRRPRRAESARGPDVLQRPRVALDAGVAHLDPRGQPRRRT